MKIGILSKEHANLWNILFDTGCISVTVFGIIWMKCSLFSEHDGCQKL